MKAWLKQKDLICVVLISLGLAALFQVMYPWAEIWGDETFYLRLTESPFVPCDFPWTYRLLTPLLVSAIPLPIYWGYRTVTALATAGVMTGLYLLSRRMGASVMLSGALLALYAAHPQAHYLASHCALVDMTTTLFLVLSLHAFLFQQEWLLSSSLLLGVLNHESMMWFLPTTWVVACWERPWKPAMVRAVILCVPALLVFGVSRFLLPIFSDQAVVEKITELYIPYMKAPPRFIEGYLNHFLDQIRQTGGFFNLLAGCEPAGGAAVLVPLAAVGLYRMTARGKSLLVFMVLNTVFNRIFQARTELSYFNVPVILAGTATVFSWCSAWPLPYQVITGAICLAGMGFAPHSWIFGIMIATAIYLSRVYIPIPEPPTAPTTPQEKKTESDYKESHAKEAVALKTRKKRKRK